MNSWVITIDGPAGVGKSTVARMLAHRLGAVFLDTGATYRAVTLAAMEANVDLTNTLVVLEVMDDTNFSFIHVGDKLKVLIDGQDVTEAIRLPQVTENVKFIASQRQLRDRLVQLQRDFADQFEKVVAEGRDQGTIVFPDAKFKFYLTADPKVRVRRRHAELEASGKPVDFETLARQIVERDVSDEKRKVGPLKPADDAIMIDTTVTDAEGVVNKMLEFIEGHHGDSKE